jgi:catechol 2,3-dioxygenase-like lactoylglutathione lyase family enzyme
MAITGTHHVALKAKDFTTLRGFYRNTLGLQEVGAFDGNNIVFFAIGDTTIELIDAAPDGPTGAFAHLALEVDDITEMVAALEQTGISFHVPVRAIENAAGETVAWIAFFRDPEGNELELFQPVGSRYPQGTPPIDRN